MIGGDGQEAAPADIAQLHPIYVVANISTQQALQIRANLDQWRLTLTELHPVPIEASLSDDRLPASWHDRYVAPQIDPATGTPLVRGIIRIGYGGVQRA
jgi:hypothetical protein